MTGEISTMTRKSADYRNPRERGPAMTGGREGKVVQGDFHVRCYDSKTSAYVDTRHRTLEKAQKHVAGLNPLRYSLVRITDQT